MSEPVITVVRKWKRKRKRVRSLQERFESFYIPEPNSGCWLWEGRVDRRGYGRLKEIGRKFLAAHRLSWTLHRSEIPPGMYVLHKCDTPLCVNPDHLFLGTHLDNMRDMVQKGRARGKPRPSNRFPYITSNPSRPVL